MPKVEVIIECGKGALEGRHPVYKIFFYQKAQIQRFIEKVKRAADKAAQEVHDEDIISKAGKNIGAERR